MTREEALAKAAAVVNFNDVEAVLRAAEWLLVEPDVAVKVADAQFVPRKFRDVADDLWVEQENGLYDCVTYRGAGYCGWTLEQLQNGYGRDLRAVSE